MKVFDITYQCGRGDILTRQTKKCVLLKQGPLDMKLSICVLFEVKFWTHSIITKQHTLDLANIRHISGARGQFLVAAAPFLTEFGPLSMYLWMEFYLKINFETKVIQSMQKQSSYGFERNNMDKNA